MRNIAMRQAHNIEEKERSDDIKIDENVTFRDMFLSDSVLSGLHSCGFYKPSPIQLAAIPLGRCGLDLVVQAKSGTGKTCVFSVVALEMICVTARTTQVLIIAPTREIAVQICEVIKSLSSAMPTLKVNVFIGGMSVEEDKAKLKLCHIAIGTPGRLNQLISIGALCVKYVRLLVFDEADQLLNNQFKEDILNLVKTAPHNKQVLALSATYSTEITEFLDKFMRSPSHVRLGKEEPALLSVYQYVRILPHSLQSHQRHKIKFKELLAILSAVPFNQCLIFSNSQLRTESISNQLKSAGWPSLYLTGGQHQEDRLKSYFALCSYKCRILVSTDLSARGLDSEHVNLVINLDVPNDQATYLHRVGRSGRYGTKGVAISIVCRGDEWDALQAVATLSNVHIKVLQDDYNVDVKNYRNLDDVQHLSESKCCDWVNKNKKNSVKERGIKNLNDDGNQDCNFPKTSRFNSNSVIVNGEKIIKQNENPVSTALQHLSCNNTFNFTFEEVNKSMENIKIESDNTATLEINSCYKSMPTKSALQVLDKYLDNLYQNQTINPTLKKNSSNTIHLVENKQNTYLEEDQSNKVSNSSDCSFRNRSKNSCDNYLDESMNSCQNITGAQDISYPNTLNDNSKCLTGEMNNKSDSKKLPLKGNKVNGKTLKKAKGLNDNSKCLTEEINNKSDSKKLPLKGNKVNGKTLTKAKAFSLNTGYGEWKAVEDVPTPRHLKNENCPSSFFADPVADRNGCNSNLDYYADNLDSSYDYTDSDTSSEDSLSSSDESCYWDQDYASYCALTNTIIGSAKKFCDMMNFAQNAGKISARMAKNLSD